MKLINYINAPNHPKDIINLEFYESINYKCEIHNTNLEIEDGWEHSWEIMYYTDYEFEAINPHCIPEEEYLGKKWQDKDVKKKIIYCKTCEKNLSEKRERQQEESLKNQKPKKVKGRKSQKYKNEK